MMSMRGDLASLVFTICFLLAGKLPWSTATELEHVVAMKQAFCHLAAEGQVAVLAGTRCQERLRSYYHAVTTPEYRKSTVQSPRFRSCHHTFMHAGWLTTAPIPTELAQQHVLAACGIATGCT
jgi:hypothetical protein